VINIVQWAKAENMVSEARNDELKRCFIVAPPGQESARLARIFTEKGFECYRAEDIAPPGKISEEILTFLKEADFVVSSLHGDISPNLAFELGLAHAWHKPILIFTTNYDRLFDNLHRIFVVRAEPDKIQNSDRDIDWFLRHANTPLTVEVRQPASLAPGDYGWARERAAALRNKPTAHTALEFERLVAEIFEKAGAQVVQSGLGADQGADLIVWFNDLAFVTGGPMLVQCKYYGGGSGSVIANAKHTVERLERLVRGSDANLAILVFYHDRHKPPPNILDTPRVLSFAVEQLIDVVENGSFADEVIRRRKRAALSQGATL
jgi:nucleoside 2-deoxyribosyltransferase